MMERSATSLEETNIRIASVLSRTGRLSGGQRQAVAVGRAVSWGSRVLLLDEPTAALGVEQQQRVGELIKRVAANGIAVLLISHNLPQVYEICDRVVVLFHGETVANLRTSEIDIDDIVGWITGSALAARRLHEGQA
jgi:ABC-type sugar transport system ATPase subunit